MVLKPSKKWPTPRPQKIENQLEHAMSHGLTKCKVGNIESQLIESYVNKSSVLPCVPHVAHTLERADGNFALKMF